jgi:hypothetical protein
MEATQENFIEFVNRQDRGHSIEHRGSDDFMASWENCAVGVFISQCDTEDSPDSFANEVLDPEIMEALGGNTPPSVHTYGELSDFIVGDWLENG